MASTPVGEGASLARPCNKMVFKQRNIQFCKDVIRTRGILQIRKLHSSTKLVNSFTPVLQRYFSSISIRHQFIMCNGHSTRTTQGGAIAILKPIPASSKPALSELTLRLSEGPSSETTLAHVDGSHLSPSHIIIQ
jgi:hypothetical protein